MKLAATSALALSAALVSTACHTERMPYLVDGSSANSMWDSLETMRLLAGYTTYDPKNDFTFGSDDRYQSSRRDLQVLLKLHAEKYPDRDDQAELVAKDIDGLSLDEIHEKATESYLFLVARYRQKMIGWELEGAEGATYVQDREGHKKWADKLAAMPFTVFEQRFGYKVWTSPGRGSHNGIGRSIMGKSLSSTRTGLSSAF
ncbi:hypothetical protein HNP46_006089 [Pseudomonas nitritireducens]|uniref:Uncharacterized protein n=1 Tax=Pseudomonas nitroreducens TaxID=46680 RepID=A0A7W7KRJ0_PSENT|nr:hypothetical protein [Pseudomonas nitritireducens]MBB4867178.1 hypothetical protein [Pseudomonas nitritireducens]